MVKTKRNIDEGSWIWNDPNHSEPFLILFVHGFMGHAEETWGEFPNLIRQSGQGFDVGVDVASFGFSTLVPDPKGIPALSGTLLSFLEAQSPASQALFIVCHSLGGPVARQMMVEAFTQNRSLFNRVRQIHFIASPHYGWAPLQGILGKILGILSQKMVQDLRPDQPVLGQTMEGWANVLKLLGEEKKTQPGIINYVGNMDTIVPLSRVIGPVNPDETIYMVEGDHQSLKMLRSTEQTLYKLITRSIRADMPKIPTSTPNVVQASQPSAPVSVPINSVPPPKPNTFKLTGKQRLDFTRALGEKWRDLAILLDIKDYEQRIIEANVGYEGVEILTWLEKRRKLHLLPMAVVEAELDYLLDLW